MLLKKGIKTVKDMRQINCLDNGLLQHNFGIVDMCMFIYMHTLYIYTYIYIYICSMARQTLV